jgi:hypothetical protein
MVRQGANWEAMFKALVAFHEAQGHCDIPVHYPPDPRLGRWVAMQRYRRRVGEMSKECAARLDQLGFIWAPTDQVWNTMWAHLAAYKKKHGNCDVPSIWPENPHLANWVANQRHRRKTGALSPERVKKLDALGFAWAVYGKAKPGVQKPVVKAPAKTVAKTSVMTAPERLYLVCGSYVQYNGKGELPQVVARYLKSHGGEYPPYIPLPSGPVTFRIGEDTRAGGRRYLWGGQGPLPGDVLDYLNEHGALPTHS